MVDLQSIRTLMFLDSHRCKWNDDDFGILSEIEKLRDLVRYLGQYAEEQGADFGLFADSEPDLFDYELYLSVTRLPT